MTDSPDISGDGGELFIGQRRAAQRRHRNGRNCDASGWHQGRC
jgi:hypothetical protein